MQLKMLRGLLECDVLTGEDALDIEVDGAVASDAMSVVLASPHPRALMITALTSIQSVRTAQLAYLPAIIYVRGSRPTEMAIKLARDNKTVLLSTKLSMFDCCGILYSQGIRGAT